MEYVALKGLNCRILTDNPPVEAVFLVVDVDVCEVGGVG